MKNFATKAIFSMATILVATSAFAEEAVTATTEASKGGLSALAAGIAIGVAVLGGTLGQGKAASAALEGIARNPAAQDKIFVPMILGLALIESLVVLAFLVSFIKLS